MLEKMKQLRVNVTVSAVLTVVLGVLLVMYSGSVLNIFSRIFALIVLIIGVVMAAGGVIESRMSRLISGVVVLAVGIWAYSSPEAISSIIPIAIGVLLVVHGVQDLRLALDARRSKSDSVGAMLIVSFVSIIFGLICIAKAFQVVSFAVQLVGIMLVIDGIKDIFVVHKVNQAERDIIDAEVYTEEDVEDAEAVEVSGEIEDNKGVEE